MDNNTKIWLIIATVLVISGVVILTIVMGSCRWDFNSLSTESYKTTNHIVGENFSSISINTDTADITFALSDTSNGKVECYESEKIKYSVKVENDTLNIMIVDERQWYDYIGINTGTPKITVYLPEGEYKNLVINENTGNVEISDDFRFETIDISTDTGDVKNYASATGDIKIKTTTGSIRIGNVTSDSMSLSVSTGKISAESVDCEGDIEINVSTGKVELNDVKCENLTSKGDTGKITLHSVIADGTISIERSTGDIVFDGCDADEIYALTDTGDVSGTLLSDKIFTTETETGRVNVPKTTSGGKCEIVTDTGNINIKIKK